MTATTTLTGLDHLDALEAEAIHILRETAAECARPVLLYSIGKDSAVLLHLARKAFWPGAIPFPLLHVDTTWKFRDMYALRDQVAADSAVDLLIYKSPEGEARGINPFDHGSAVHTDIWKTQGLKQALDLQGFDAAIGGARRDEEVSRAKERIFSFRAPGHRWDPRRQRPELWRLYNARVRPGETMRVFPLSNWTEADVWNYIARESIEVVPLYFSAPRPVVERAGVLIVWDDPERAPPPGVPVQTRQVRFRTLGCWPLSGAIESEAVDLAGIIAEMKQSRQSERQGRLIDRDVGQSMEAKKAEGYF